MIHYHKNPRKITAAQMAKLKGTLPEFGDLSGITHDLDTDEILSGNQRCEALPGIMSGLIQPEITQRFDPPLEDGTSLLGYFLIDGRMYNYRGVTGWDDKKREQAVIIANKAGGSFDYDILADKFDVSTLLDSGFSEFELLDTTVQTLDDLEDEYGSSNKDDFYPIIKIKVTPEIKERFDAVMKKMMGENEMEKINALISCGELS